MPRFDLNLLGALDALLTERSVTRAAERLHVTQPTMSGMLQRLRYQFDDQLLMRVGRNMQLTQFGAALIRPVREALRNVEALAAAEPNFDPSISARTFTIMASDYCSLIFIPRVISRLARIAPDVRIIVQPLCTPIEKLQSGDVDLCITSDDRGLFGNYEDGDGVRSSYLFSDEFVCVVAQNHVLRGAISIDQYLTFPHVGVQLAGNLNTIEAACVARHLPNYKPSYVVPDFSLIPGMVAASNLIGVVQERLAEIASRTLSIRTLAPPFKIPQIKETLYWHTRYSTEPSHAWLRGVVEDEAAAWLNPAEPLGEETSFTDFAGLESLPSGPQVGRMSADPSFS